MLSIQSETINLIKASLEYLEETKHAPLLASLDDCAYFRKHYQSPIEKPQVPKPKPLPKEVVLPPVVEKIEPPVKTLQPPPKIVAEISSLPEVQIDHFEDVRKIWAKISPQAPILEEIPGDAIAKKIATRWKTKNITAEISILAYHEPPAQRALLEQIAKALDVVFGPAKIVQAEPIEKEKQWEAFLSVPHLKLTIACDYTLWQLGGLMHHYKEIPNQKTRHLGTVPVFLLPDLSLYLKDPHLKRSLWKAICQTLS